MIQTSEFRSMGSRIFVALDSSDPHALTALRQVPSWFGQAEAIFSRFDPNSELSRLNQSQGSAFHASPEMIDVLLLARNFRQITNGILTPTVLDALISTGYDSDFSISQWLDRSGDSKMPLLPPDSQDFEIDAAAGVVLLPHNVRLDLGGFAKGWMAHQVMIRLSSFAPVLVNAGGDIAVSGSRSDGQPWLIGIENPLDTRESVGMVNLTEGGIATSGKDYRQWMKDGKIQHHLINPWTGLPAVSDVFTATVIAPDVMTAEAAAKVAVIAGSESGSQWLESQNDLAWLLQLESGRIISNLSFDHYLWQPLEINLLQSN